MRQKSSRDWLGSRSNQRTLQGSLNYNLQIPGQTTVSLGFHSDGSPGDPVPAVQLFMLPVIDAFYFAASLGLGLYFYRSVDRGDLGPTAVPGLVWLVLAYLLWGSSALTSLFLLVGVALIA